MNKEREFVRAISHLSLTNRDVRTTLESGSRPDVAHTIFAVYQRHTKVCLLASCISTFHLLTFDKVEKFDTCLKMPEFSKT